MELQNDNSIKLSPTTTIPYVASNLNINDQHQSNTINQIRNVQSLPSQSLTTSIPSRHLSSRIAIKSRNSLSINERCMQLVTKALIKEKRLRQDIEQSSQDQSFDQRQIYSMQLKVQECQNIIGTTTQLIRMIGDTYRSTAQNIR